MYILMDDRITCKICGKQDEIKKVGCGDCTSVRRENPEGWTSYPKSFSGTISYPTPMVCPDCRESEEYKKASDDVFNELKSKSGFCKSCGEKENQWTISDGIPKVKA